VFRRLQVSELERAYAIVCEADAWLSRNRLPHWCVPYDVYHKRQMSGENYGWFVNCELAVVVTLRACKPLGWDDHIPEREVMWLSTLNTAQRFRGRRLGDVMLEHVERHLSEQNVDVLYLDCYYGFLSDYYAARGFEWIARLAAVFEDGSLHDNVLMRKRIRIRS
jgi:hypothetical protein